ncbi:MAG: hypothetical protein QF535_03480, partial [Anaerolineales bacterium]|nr:hypothetical protein [Anaerolineales bacterium]
ESRVVNLVSIENLEKWYRPIILLKNIDFASRGVFVCPVATVYGVKSDARNFEQKSYHKL